MLKISKGAICYDDAGKLGLVLSEGKVKTGAKGDLRYIGINLTNPNFGAPWSSKSPFLAAIIDINNGNIKLPSQIAPIILPNSTLIKILKPADYGIEIEQTE